MKATSIIIALTLATTALSAGECTEKSCYDCRQDTSVSPATNYCVECNKKAVSGTDKKTKCDGDIGVKDCERAEWDDGKSKCSMCKFGKLIQMDTRTCIDAPEGCIGGFKASASGKITCTFCKRGKKLKTDSSGCEDKGSDTEAENCQYNSSATGGKIACALCNKGYYTKDGGCTKYADGADPACQEEDPGNTDNKCKACRQWEGWFEVGFDGTNVTCKKNAFLPSVFLSILSLGFWLKFNFVDS